MADLNSLDPENRAFVLVGQFLHGWATVESALHACIQTAFKLTPIMNHIICANVDVRHKLDILRTVVFVSAFETESERNQFTKLLRRVGKYSLHRNLVVHTSYQPAPSKAGVQFAYVKASGKYEADPVVWTVRRFEQEGCVFDALREGLSKLNKRLNEVPIKDADYEKFLRESMQRPFAQYDWPLPMRRTSSSDLIHLLSQPPPVPPDSDLAISKTSPQTPERPEETK